MSVEKTFHCYNGHAFALIAGGSDRLRDWAVGHYGINVYLVAAGISTPVAKLFALRQRSPKVDLLLPGAQAGCLRYRFHPAPQSVALPDSVITQVVGRDSVEPGVLSD